MPTPHVSALRPSCRVLTSFENTMDLVPYEQIPLDTIIVSVLSNKVPLRNVAVDG
jgi:hypothetical protein